MLPNQVREIIGEPPYMTVSDAELIFRLMNNATPKPRSVLELGFMCGTSTCYYAGMMEELGGEVTSIDVKESAEYNPLAEDQLEKIGLRDRVTIYREERCYTWKLMKFLQQPSRPMFDWIHIDGAHKWTEDTAAVTLVEKLMPVGGYLLIDNIRFSFGHPARNPKRIERCAAKYTEEEMMTPQMGNVWKLVVQEHPNLGEFREYDVQDGWGYGVAKKIRQV